MNIFKRLGKIIEANLNHLIDKVEEQQNKDHLKDESSFTQFDEIAKKIEIQEEINSDAKNLQEELKKLKEKIDKR